MVWWPWSGPPSREPISAEKKSRKGRRTLAEPPGSALPVSEFVRIMRPMRSRDVQNESIDSFEPGPLPPMGPDGAPLLEPVRIPAADPPRLCEAGPCRRYHVMKIQLDAQQPGRERLEDGTVIDHARVFHTEAHYYCYPDVGIETNLGSQPVLECNRWVPITSLFRGKHAIRREYDRKFAAWHDQRETEDADASAAGEDGLVAIRFALGIADDSGAIRFWPNETPPPTLAIPRSLTVEAIIEEEVSERLGRGRPARALLRSVTIDGHPLDNTDVTVAELGLEDGATLTVTYNLKETV